MTTETQKEFNIDASGEKLGRVAGKVASILMGKNRVDFAKNENPDVRVKIVNAGKLDVKESKLEQKVYKRYSGFPGGQTVESMKRLKEKKGLSGALRIAIKGMLPKNKLQARMLKNLTIKE